MQKKTKQKRKENLQLNNIIFYSIEADLFDAGEFDLRWAAAFHFQLASVVVYFTAYTFFRAIAVIGFDIFRRKYQTTHTGTKQQWNYEQIVGHCEQHIEAQAAFTLKPFFLFQSQFVIDAIVISASTYVYTLQIKIKINKIKLKIARKTSHKCNLYLQTKFAQHNW